MIRRRKHNPCWTYDIENQAVAAQRPVIHGYGASSRGWIHGVLGSACRWKCSGHGERARYVVDSHFLDGRYGYRGLVLKRRQQRVRPANGRDAEWSEWLHLERSNFR